jgi:hypothetical protein
MHGDNVGRNFADDAPRDILTNAGLGYWHHGNGGGGRKPIRFIVATGVIANVIEIAEYERHRAEPLQTRSGVSEILSVSAFVSFHVQ